MREDNSATDNRDETADVPAFTQEMEESLEVTHRRKPQSPRPASSTPGKLRFVGSGLPPKFLSSIEFRNEAGFIIDALITGDQQRLSKALATFYTSSQGDHGQLLALSKILVEELDHWGVMIKSAVNSLAFHKQGSAFGVQFRFDRDINFADNSTYTTVTVHSYNWDTKRDEENVDPSIIIAEIGQLLKGKTHDCKIPFQLGWLR